MATKSNKGSYVVLKKSSSGKQKFAKSVPSLAKAKKLITAMGRDVIRLTSKGGSQGKLGNPELSGSPKGYNWELVFVEWPKNTSRVEKTHNFEVASYERAVDKAKYLAGASQEYSHIDNRVFEFAIYNKGKLKGYAEWNLKGNSANIKFTKHKASKFENPSKGVEWVPIATALSKKIADKYVLFFKIKGVNAKAEKLSGRQSGTYRVYVDKNDEYRANQVYSSVRYGAMQSNPRKNPSSLSSSESLVEEFHGRAPTSVDDIVSFEEFPSSLGELGVLIELVVISNDGSEEIPISFDEEGPGMVRLASAPGGTQYVLVGGDQSISEESLEEDFGIRDEGEGWKRKLVLGEIASLTYFTDKHHLSGPKYQKDGCLYEHQLGEEGGELPTLLYDPNNESLEIVGGSYVTKEEGIRN